MASLVTLLVLLSAGMYAPSELPAAAGRGSVLRYHRPLGQVAQYHLSLDVQGGEVSLGERLPVRWKAEAEVSEEVIARAGDGSFWLRVTSRPIETTGGNGAFANGAAAQWPGIRLHLSPRGEVLEAAEPETRGPAPARERAFAALMTDASPVILPEGPVVPGDHWQGQSNASHQTNRLVSLQGGGDKQIARIASVATSPLTLDETVDQLGLQTHLSGEARQSSELWLLVASGLVRRQTGRTHIVTKSQTTLSLPEGRPFDELRVTPHGTVRATPSEVEGRPVGSR